MFKWDTSETVRLNIPISYIEEIILAEKTNFTRLSLFKGRFINNVSIVMQLFKASEIGKG